MRFLKNALSALNKIYKFESGTVGIDQLDLVSPIQLVHDTSREAELAAINTSEGAGGFFQVGQDNVHPVGGETIESTIAPYDSLPSAGWGQVGERWIWLMQYGATASSTGVFGGGANARLTVSIAALAQALARRDFLICGWGPSDRETITTDLSATFPVALSVITAPAELRQQGIQLPFPIFPGSKLTWRTSATAANPGTIRLSTLCWIGPIGVYPPGLR